MPNRRRLSSPRRTQRFGVIAIQHPEFGGRGIGGQERGGFIEGDVEVMAEAAGAGLIGAGDVDHVFCGTEVTRGWWGEEGLPVGHVERGHGRGGDFGCGVRDWGGERGGDRGELS